MPIDRGTQQITVKFFDPVDSDVANRIGVGVRKRGIYSGGYLTRVDDVTVTLSTLDCEIGDGTYQVRGTTGTTVNNVVSTVLPYIVLRWAYTGSASVDYIDILSLALGSIAANDVVVGKCVFAGSTLTGFDYTLRTTPLILDLFLKVEPKVPASMYLRVRAGRASYGASNFDIVDQDSPLFTAPGSNSRIDLLQINTSGAVIVTQGVSAASPVPPAYGGLVTLAEVTIAAGQTTLTSSSVKDVRSFSSPAFNSAVLGTMSTQNSGTVAITGGTITGITDLAVADGGTGASTQAAAINNLLPSQAGNGGKSVVTDGANVSFDYGTYAP